MDEALVVSTMARIIASPARSSMLLALSDGRALPATELAYRAGVSSATASEHLAYMRKIGILATEKSGRHHYYRVISPRIMEVLEDLLTSYPGPNERIRPELARITPLREARMCYDHLAGRLGVALTGSFQKKEWLVLESIDFRVTDQGRENFERFGIDWTSLSRSRRRLARRCIDWTERTPHVGGALGAALTCRLVALDWIRRTKESRIVIVTTLGRRNLQDMFGIPS